MAEFAFLKKKNFFPYSSISIASSLVGEDAKTKFLSKMGQLTTSSAMLANVFQRKKWTQRWPPHGTDGSHHQARVGLFQFAGKKKRRFLLSVDENQMSLIHLPEMKAALTVFHFRVFVREDAFDLQTSDRVFKVGCKKAFSRTREKEERAWKKTLDSI